MIGEPIPRSRPFLAFLEALGLLAILAALALPLHAQSLRGSAASLDVQNRMARSHEFTYLSSGSQVLRFVREGYLVPLRGNVDFDLHAVSYPYTRPEVELFVRRLASQYREACGEKLVVTSLTRPTSGQPRNASDRSVHPTGMAVDLRRSNVRACRSWLEDTLLELEGARVVEATRERHPAHYHVAVFPHPYYSYVDKVVDEPIRLAAANPVPGPVIRFIEYEVRRGDSLWGIAREYDTTVARLRAENDLRSTRIYAGQVLDVPVSR